MKTSTPYADYLPPLSTEERQALEADIRANGVRHPVEVTEDGRVLDGHNRLSIQPDAPTVVIAGSAGWSDEECMAWIAKSNSTRRNLSPEQKRELAAKNRKAARVLKERDPVFYTQEKLAGMFGVDQSTVSDWLRSVTRNMGSHIASKPEPAIVLDSRVKVRPEQKQVIVARIEAGEKQEQVAADAGVSQQTISRIVTKEKKHQEQRKEVEKVAASLGTDDQGIITGDFRKAGSCVADSSVQLIFTDPPYHEEHVGLYEDLAAFAARVLAPGGLCVTYCGQSFLPRVLTGMSKHLNYVWTFAIIHTGGDLRLRKWQLRNGWKPVLCFGKPPIKAWWDWMRDVTSGGKEKDIHQWQQAESEAAHFIESLSTPDGLVCDPFAGGGTTSLVCKSLNRRCVAFEIDKDAARTARARVAKGKR